MGLWIGNPWKGKGCPETNKQINTITWDCMNMSPNNQKHVRMVLAKGKDKMLVHKTN